MSLVALGRLARELGRRDGARAEFVADAPAFLSGFDLTPAEREAVLDLDAAALVGLGLNPLVMRNILVAAGVGNPDMYSHTMSLRPRA